MRALVSPVQDGGIDIGDLFHFYLYVVRFVLFAILRKISSLSVYVAHS